jgi:plastocyanin
MAQTVAADTVEVLATGVLTFEPPDITITVGDSVHWTGLSLGFHTVAEVDDAAAFIWNGGFHSAAGASEFTFTFNTPGAFFYVCEPHVLDGMRGSITVEAAACLIVSMETCMDHDAPCGNLCLPLDCTTCSSVEPRLQLGTPPTLLLDLGTCGCNSASVSVSCSPNAYGGSASVACTTNGATVTFSGTLPDQSCCTLTFTGDIVDVRTLAMLETDVNSDCAVTAADAASVKQRIGTPANAPPPFGGAQYDVNRDCNITSSDFASVKARLGRIVPPCPCP